MEHDINTVNETSLKIGHKIQKGKPKITKNIDTTDDIQIVGTETEKVTNYKYQGQTTPMENRTKEEGCKVSWKTNHCWRDDTVGQHREVWKKTE